MNFNWEIESMLIIDEVYSSLCKLHFECIFWITSQKKSLTHMPNAMTLIFYSAILQRSSRQRQFSSCWSVLWQLITGTRALVSKIHPSSLFHMALPWRPESSQLLISAPLHWFNGGNGIPASSEQCHDGGEVWMGLEKMLAEWSCGHPFVITFC